MLKKKLHLIIPATILMLFGVVLREKYPFPQPTFWQTMDYVVFSFGVLCMLVSCGLFLKASIDGNVPHVKFDQS